MSEKTKKTSKQERRARQQQRLDAELARGRRKTLLIWGTLAASALAAIVGAFVLLSADSGTAGPGERPYVGGDFHALAVYPANPERVMVGGHDGAALSEDGGETWLQIPDLEGADPMGWSVDPQDPQKMYVGGHPGFYRSEDGGDSWEQDNSGLPGTDVHGLGIDPQNPETLYAYIVGEGIYRSPDAAGSWELVNDEKSLMGPILVDPRDSDTLYLAEMEGGFQQSTDGGESWRQLGTVPGGMVTWISQDRQAPDTFYAAAGEVSKSTDGGESWQPTGGGLPGGVSVVAVSPSDSRIVYAGVLDGTEAHLFRSEDGGESWEAQN